MEKGLLRMKKIKSGWLILLLIMICGGCSTRTEKTEISGLTTNDKINPIGIKNEVYFSWKMISEEDGQKQTAYQIFVSDSSENLERQQYVWDSGKVDSDKSVAIPYEGLSLEAQQNYVWKVKVWDKEDKEFYSQKAYFELGKGEGVWENTKWIVVPQKREDLEEAKAKDNVWGNDVKQLQNDTYGNLNEVSYISYDFKMDNTETGFIWGAKEGAYGDYYLWSLQTTEGKVQLKILRKDGERTVEIKENVDLSFGTEEFLNKEHSVKIEIIGGKAFTFLDEQLVSEDVVIEDLEAGSIGFYVRRGEEKAWYDNICVKNSKGDILYRENFDKDESFVHKYILASFDYDAGFDGRNNNYEMNYLKEGENIFSPYYIKIENGWGRADSGIIVTGGGEVPNPMFRKTFNVEEGKALVSARLYAAALGSYDIYVNGTDINPYYMAPGQSVYSKEVYYRTYDVTEYLKDDENVLGIILGHGRYDRAKGAWGEQPALYAQLLLSYEDGSKQIIGTDESWSVCVDGPIRNEDLFSGEYYSAKFVQEDWTMEGFAESEDAGWKKAIIYTPEQELVLNPSPDGGVICVETLTPISVTEPVKGVYVYDFGRNFNGTCRLRLSGKEGDVVTMRYGEYLNTEMLQNKDDITGTIWTRNLCTADNTDYYVFGKEKEVTYSPTFSYRGFRYLQITGLDKALPLEAIEGMVISTDSTRTGYFECSDEYMNQLYEAIYRSQLSNYVDTPTDCPQRDERLGWTGDAQVFAYTGALNANTANFMYKYIDALRVSQTEEGAYQQIVPFVDKIGGANGWSDAGIILVWEMYQQYGNENVIKENLQAMCRYVDYLISTSDNFIRNFEGYNDHNSLSTMDLSCCNTAQCAYVSGLLTRMCEVVDEVELAKKYREIYGQYVSAWQTAYLEEDGSIGEWLQSEYVMALAYGLYPQELELAGAEKLKISIEGAGNQISTGYVTTPHILSVLCKYGYVDTAYRLIQQKGYPSWNYMLEQASSLTEGWNTLMINEAGEISINGSLNHVALGAVGQWFYTDVLGICRDETQPAYKHFYLEPKIGGNLTWAKGSYNSVYGKIESSWEVTNEGVNLRFVVPANTTATMTLPGTKYQEVELEAGVHEFFVSENDFS